MSSIPDGGYDPRTFAADLAALLRRLDTGPVVAVGHSLGGMIVAALAVEHPEVVRATVAVDPAYGMDASRADRVSRLVAQLGTPEGNELVAGVLAATETQAPDWLRHWHRRRAIGNP